MLGIYGCGNCPGEIRVGIYGLMKRECGCGVVCGMGVQGGCEVGVWDCQEWVCEVVRSE